MKVYNFDIEKSKILLELNLELRWKNPKLFENRDFLSEEFQKSLKMFQFFLLPQKTESNNKVSFFRVTDTNPDTYCVLELCRMMLAVMDIRYVTIDEDLEDSDIAIIDMKGFGFKHFLKNTASLSLLKTNTKYAQEAVPVRVIQSHYINCSSAVYKFYSFLKPFISKEVQNSIKIHENLNSLYDFVPKAMLPNEYGGSAGLSDDLHKDWVGVMMRKK